MTDETPDGKARRLVVVTELRGEHKGFRLWSYFPLPFDKKSPSAWKQAQFLNAVLGKEKGSIDPDRPGDLQEFKIQLGHRAWDGEMRGDLKTFIPLSDDDEDDEDVEENGDAEGDDEITMEELEGYTSKQLLAFLEENELEPPDDLPRSASAKKAALLEYIEAELFADGVEDTEPEDDEDDEDDEEDEDEDVDLSGMSLAELKVYAQENGVTLPAGLKGTKGKAAAIAAIEEAAHADGEEPEEDDYDEWELAELKKELADRSLTVKGRVTEAKAIAALRADDAEENPV